MSGVPLLFLLVAFTASAQVATGCAMMVAAAGRPSQMLAPSLFSPVKTPADDNANQPRGAGEGTIRSAAERAAVGEGPGGLGDRTGVG